MRRPTSLLLLSLLLWPAAVIAQSGENVGVTERSALQRQLEAEIMCTCGCRSPMGSCPMRPNCGHYDTQAARLNTYLAEGKDYDAVRVAFVQEFGGQAVLAAPIDTGFNRLAWFFPYLVAVAGARWHRRDRAPLVAAKPRRRRPVTPVSIRR